ncbi:MAG: hypothetical protein LVS60_15225 [Nodosilinea sp. LVE1205-7]
MIVISDTSAITNLTAIQHLQLLPQLYNQVTIPEAVYRELAEIDPPVPGTFEVQTSPWFEVRQVVDRVMVERLQVEMRLDPGEFEVIALALELIVGVAVLKLSVGTNTCRGRLNSIVTHEGPPKVMGR